MKQSRNGRQLSWIAIVAISVSFLLARSIRAEEPPAEAVWNAVGIRHGLVVHVGAMEGAFAEAIAKNEQLLVQALALDAATETQLRLRFVKAGIHGQATAARVGADGSLPLADQVASIVLADLDAAKTLKREELLRVLRPLGKAYFKSDGKWAAVDKPRSKEVDNWPQYFHDAAMSDVSSDIIAGPARGLQWQVGPQDTHSDGVRVIDDLVIGHDAEGLWARDAFNGLPLWRRPGMLPATRFGWLVDSSRIYIFPGASTGGTNLPNGIPSRCQLALDLRTGKTVLEYNEGLTFKLPAEMPKDPAAAKELQQALKERARDFQARLIDGLLIQVAGPGLAVLDAQSGKRLWSAQALDGMVWGHPLASGDTLYAVQGTWAQAASYTHWPVTVVERVLALDLKTGQQRWVWEWKKEMPAIFTARTAGKDESVRKVTLEAPEQRGAIAYNMALDQGRLVFALRAETKQVWQSKGLVRQLVLDARTGRFVTYGATPADKDEKQIGTIGGGHSGFRVLPVGGRWWFPNIIGVYGNTDPAAPTDAEKFERAYSKLLRPVGCTVYRASPKYLFGSLTTYALDGSEVQQTNVARTTCDVGAFPANGMTYITPNHCFCNPYLPGHNVFNPRRPLPPDDSERLDAGTGKPAPVPAASDDNWPAYLRDNLRSSWNGTTVPDKLQAIWTLRPAQPLESLVGKEWANQWYGQGPVTGVSVAEGVAVFALTDRQEIIAIDPATGKERWRASVEGRIDSQPTIAQGIVFAGTRSGFLYAFNRDSGERIWTFRAAPRRQQIVVNGQLESLWPLFGTVTVDAEGVWAVAGRHNDCDGGLWWWRLDAATGKALANGRFGRDELRKDTGDTGAISPDPEWPNCANSPPVTNDKLFLMPRLRCVRENGQLVPATIAKNAKKIDEHMFWASAYEVGILVPGNQGLLNRTEFLGGYKMSAFGHVQARMFAYRDNRFVCVGGADGAVQHRGGDKGSWVRAFDRKAALESTAVPNKKEPDRVVKKTFGSDLKWDNPMPLTRGDGTDALAVAGDKVLVGFSVVNSDQSKEKQRLPFRLLVLGLADGKEQQTLALPAKPILGGISACAGRVYVTTSDGSITCFAAARE
ncbi:MAG: PQQ-binding-like beta-propeller repeat protein [Planctomycetota bacterium]